MFDVVVNFASIEQLYLVFTNELKARCFTRFS